MGGIIVEMLSFAWWTLASGLIVAAYQLVVGYLVGQHLELEPPLIRGLLRLSGCLAAGLVVGVVSPGRRLLEPALGALAACLSVPGTPWLAFPVTFAGAWLGERWSRS